MHSMKRKLANLPLGKQIEFTNHKKEILRGYVHVPTEEKKVGVACIFLHGFPGSMENTAHRVCYGLYRRGFLAMRFEFSGTNTSDGKFEDKRISKEVKEIKYAIDFLEKEYKCKKIVLIGHSTGAINAALYAHKDSRVAKLVLLAGVSKLDEGVRYDFTDRQVHDFWKKGHIVYKREEKWYHNMKLPKAYYDEFFTLNIPQAIKKFRRPVLIVHGSHDEAIPLHKDPQELLSFANRPKKLVIVRGADHRFMHPRHLQHVVREISLFSRPRPRSS